MNANDEKDTIILELKNINLMTNFGTTQLLNNISLQINHQERIGIVGASGAGKSTLLKLFNYLHSPNQGEFFFRQKLINNVNPLQLRQEVVLVLQEPKLLSMTVRSSLVYPLELQMLSEPEIKERLSWCLDILSIPQAWLSRQENELSVGQRQLVSIARGLIMRPKVLLLDEPTSALDSGKSHWLRETLINVSVHESMTMVIVNHDLEWIKNFADRIIYLNQGKIQQDLTIDKINWKIIEDNLLANNTYHDFDDF